MERRTLGKEALPNIEVDASARGRAAVTGATFG